MARGRLVHTAFGHRRKDVARGTILALYYGTGGKYINTNTFFFRINEQDEITDITFMQKDRKKLIKSKNDLEEIINYGKDTSEHITIADELFVNYEANTKSSNYY